MLILAKLVSVILFGLGIAILIRPEFMKKMFAFCKQGKRIYGGGILRIVIGLILLLVAGQSRMPWAVLSLGILFILGGSLIFVLGLEKAKSMISLWEEMPVLACRIMGLAMAAFGALILSVL